MDGSALVVSKITTGSGVNNGKGLLQIIAGFRTGLRQDLPGTPDVLVPNISFQCFWHLLWRQHEIHDARANSRTWHAIVLGRLGFLRHHHSAMFLDGLDSERAVRSRA